jgi:hypothetical protein
MDQTPPFRKIKNAKSPSSKKIQSQAIVHVSHPMTRKMSTLSTHYDRIGFIKSVLKDMNVPLIKERLTSDQLLFVRKLAREIFNGTQQPRVTVRSIAITLSSSSSTLASITSYNWGSAINQSDWALVFDEVKVLDGHFEIYRATTGIFGYCVWCIDYNSSAALASYSDALAYDTHLASFSGTTSEGVLLRDRLHLPVHPRGQPDLQWLATSDTTTVSAYLKAFSSQCTTTVVVANCFFQMAVEFRQVN